MTSSIIYQPPEEWMRIFLSPALCVLRGIPYTKRAPACCAVNNMHAFLHWISRWREDQHSGPNLSYPHVKSISCDAISALNSNISFRWSISTWCLIGPDEFRPQVCLQGELYFWHVHWLTSELLLPSLLPMPDGRIQGQLRESLQKTHHSRRFPSSFYVLWFPCPSSFITGSPPAYTNMLHKGCRLGRQAEGEVWAMMLLLPKSV